MRGESRKPSYYDPRRPPLSGAACELAETALLAKQACDRAGAGAISAYNETWREAAGATAGARERLAAALAWVDRAIAAPEDEIRGALATGHAAPGYAAEALKRLEDAVP
jgi:hypothetical protein